MPKPGSTKLVEPDLTRGAPPPNQGCEVCGSENHSTSDHDKFKLPRRPAKR
jgi:hypothetical protein